MALEALDPFPRSSDGHNAAPSNRQQAPSKTNHGSFRVFIMRRRGEVKKSLSDVIFGQTRGKVLALLFGNSDKRFYTRQIARMTGASVGAIAPELMLMTSLGLLISSRVGNQVFYQANRHSPVFAEIRALMAKTVGVFHQLRLALAPLADRIVVAFVYGPMAKQRETAESDVDRNPGAGCIG